MFTYGPIATDDVVTAAFTSVFAAIASFNITNDVVNMLPRQVGSMGPFVEAHHSHA